MYVTYSYNLLRKMSAIVSPFGWLLLWNQAFIDIVRVSLNDVK